VPHQALDVLNMALVLAQRCNRPTDYLEGQLGQAELLGNLVQYASTIVARSIGPP
jgi:hypothetical protein